MAKTSRKNLGKKNRKKKLALATKDFAPAKTNRKARRFKHEYKKILTEVPVNAPVILFAHGAKLGSASDWMQRWVAMLREATGAADVIAFDYPYMAKGQKRGPPPRAETLVDFHFEEMQRARAAYPGHPIVLCGKSMGSRVGCMVAGRPDADVAAVICLGYPLKAKDGLVRDSPLLELKAPILLVQGTKDAMCPPTLLEEIRSKMTAPSELYPIEGGDHNLAVRQKKQEESDKMAAANVAAFLDRALKSKKHSAIKAEKGGKDHEVRDIEADEEVEEEIGEVEEGGEVDEGEKDEDDEVDDGKEDEE